MNANILVENNVFRRVANPFDVIDYSDATSVLESRWNLFEATTGNTGDRNAPAATPPYDYVADDPCSVPDTVMALSGPR